jgi:hypothetical protein
MASHDHEGGDRNYSFDVSAQIQRLLTDRPAGEPITVLLVPSTGVTGGAPIDRARYEAAGLHIGEIALQIRSTPIPLKLP